VHSGAYDVSLLKLETYHRSFDHYNWMVVLFLDDFHDPHGFEYHHAAWSLQLGNGQPLDHQFIHELGPQLSGVPLCYGLYWIGSLHSMWEV
jgi:hypothetical protein